MVESNKEVVRLRAKKLSNGSESLYLDIYLNGRRKYEYLKLYILPGRENKSKNKETLNLANAVKAKRLVEIQNGRFGFEKKSGENMLLLDYLKNYVDEKQKKKTERYVSSLSTAFKQVERYVGKRHTTIADVDKKWCKGFISYLEQTKSKRGTALGTSTIHQYFSALVVAFNKAVETGVIEKNPFDSVSTDDRPGRGKSNRAYLTLEEIKELTNTGIRDERIKQAFLFSCFTGLRFSDIVKLTWENVRELEDGVVQLEFVQQKTRNQVVVPLNSNALQWLPSHAPVERNVFDLPHHSVVGKKLKKWAENAGIRKKVTFHVARHTYATLLLYYGADLFTVSKLLGHSNIQTTEIYAKVMDETKRKAVNLIPQI